MLGAFLSYSVWKFLLMPTFGFYIAAIIVALMLAVVGLVIELGLLRRLYSRGWPEQLLATYAIILIITDVVKWGWGGAFLSIPRPEPFTGAVDLFDFPFPSYNFFVIFLGAALVIFLWWLVYRTRLGDIIRAAAHDREMVSASGHPHSMALHVNFRAGRRNRGTEWGGHCTIWVRCLGNGYRDYH